MPKPCATPILGGYSMDFSFQIEYAKREDGVWFSRVQEKGPYGYRWRKWRSGYAPTEGTSPMPTGKCARLPRG